MVGIIKIILFGLYLYICEINILSKSCILYKKVSGYLLYSIYKVLYDTIVYFYLQTSALDFGEGRMGSCLNSWAWPQAHWNQWSLSIAFTGLWIKPLNHLQICLASEVLWKPQHENIPGFKFFPWKRLLLLLLLLLL